MQRSLSGLFSQRKNIVNALTALLGVAVFLFLALGVPSFLSVGNIINVLEQLTTMGTLCLGMTCVLIVGGIDLSMPSVLIASTTAGTLFMSRTGNWVVGILIALAVAVLFGAINGLSIAKAKMIPFIVTLSTQIVAAGFAVMVAQSKSVFGMPDAFLALGINLGIVPLSIPIFFLCAVVMHIFLKKTRQGRIFYMIGQNERTARVSGIRTDRYVFGAYIISALFACLAGLLLAARTNMAGSTMVGDTMIMDTVSSAVIGGASLNGGQGNIIGSVLGALFITLISNFINLMGISPYTGMIIKGSLIVAIIALDRLRSKE